MKRTRFLKTFILAAAALSLVLLLSACSGVIGGETGVRITVPGLVSDGDPRFLSDDADNAYVVVLKKDKIYSLNNYSDKAFYYLMNGSVYITNLPEGDYIFGVVLLDINDDNVGLAIKEVTIQPGFNDVPIEVGPGISALAVNLQPYDEFFEPSGFSVSFAEDTIELDIDRVGTGPDTVNLLVSFGDSYAPPTMGTPIIIGGASAGNNASPGAGGYLVPADSNGLSFPITYTLFSYSYNILLK